ncbi:MAG: hypothetical protein ACTMI6_09605, partial [Pseudomonas bubulae]
MQNLVAAAELREAAFGSCYKICRHKKAALRSNPKRGFFTAVLLVNSVGQAFSHNQLDNFL